LSIVRSEDDRFHLQVTLPPSGSVIREDGTRRRFTYDLWCLVSFDNGFSMIRTAEERFNP
jgi:hypothetical protein